MTTRLTRADLDEIATALDVRLADLAEQLERHLSPTAAAAIEARAVATRLALVKVQARMRAPARP